MAVSLRARGNGTSRTHGEGLWGLLSLLLFQNVAAKIRITPTQHDFRVVEGANFSIAADFEMDPGDTVASASWIKMNGRNQIIVDCSPDQVVTVAYSTYRGRGRCTMQADVIALTLTELTPNDAGVYELKMVSENGDISTEQFMGKLYEPVSNLSIQGRLDRGATLILTCKVAAGTDPIFNWALSNGAVDNSSKYIMSANRSVLTVSELESSDCRVYRCLVRNDVNDKEAHFNVSESDSFQFCRENKCYIALVVIGILLLPFVGYLVLKGVERCRKNRQRDGSSPAERYRLSTVGGSDNSTDPPEGGGE
ncbi:uncharacterized protein LOC127587219 [Pristis pectinata]|uniref:uncharacterized protein LOC127587219 n=1 Tax=Pristis pectinata TaxID=685728 RepID=UPI00223D0820|nr:uncharacterized protein LOC127587219 [Pristis pectinata]